MPSDFPGAFKGLSAVLRRHAKGLVVTADEPDNLTLITKAIGPNKKPIWFGAVHWKKSAVSFHLVPLYFNPALQKLVSPELQKRKQGKTCFNFQRPDPALFAQLDSLTRTAKAAWERFGFLEPGPLPPERLASALREGGEDPEAIARKRKSAARKSAAKRKKTLAAKLRR